MDGPFLLLLWALSLRESSSLQNSISQLLEIYTILILVKKPKLFLLAGLNLWN